MLFRRQRTLAACCSDTRAPRFHLEETAEQLPLWVRKWHQRKVIRATPDEREWDFCERPKGEKQRGRKEPASQGKRGSDWIEMHPNANNVLAGDGVRFWDWPHRCVPRDPKWQWGTGVTLSSGPGSMEAAPFVPSLES